VREAAFTVEVAPHLIHIGVEEKISIGKIRPARRIPGTPLHLPS
jgi:hypothetical protein